MFLFLSSFSSGAKKKKKGGGGMAINDGGGDLIDAQKQLCRALPIFPVKPEEEEEEDGPTAKAIDEGGQLQISGTPQQEQVLWSPLFSLFLKLSLWPVDTQHSRGHNLPPKNFLPLPPLFLSLSLFSTRETLASAFLSINPQLDSTPPLLSDHRSRNVIITSE